MCEGCVVGVDLMCLWVFVVMNEDHCCVVGEREVDVTR